MTESKFNKIAKALIYTAGLDTSQSASDEECSAVVLAMDALSAIGITRCDNETDTTLTYFYDGKMLMCYNYALGAKEWFV